MHCGPFLFSEIRQLAKKFNSSLESGHSESAEREEPEEEFEEDSEDAVPERNPEYYSSNIIVLRLTAELESLPRERVKPQFHSAWHRSQQLQQLEEDHSYCS